MVYSVYNNEFQQPFSKGLAAKLRADGAKAKDVELLKKDTSFVALNKVAIDFADGVIQGSEQINPELSEYIASKADKPFLPYQSQETYIDEINKFYDLILDPNKK